MLVLVEWDRPARSMAFARAKSARIVWKARVRPMPERSERRDRSGARLPLSIPSVVADSGLSHRRFSAIESRSAIASASAEGLAAWAKAGPENKGSAVAATRPATASRRFTNNSDKGLLRQVGGKLRSASTRRQFPSTPVMRTRSPTRPGPPRALHSLSPTRTLPECSSTASITVTLRPTSRAARSLSRGSVLSVAAFA